MADGFNKKLGFLLASVGSAVGLGSVWRFSYVATANGNGAFIIMYVICACLIGIPLILAEYVIGREATRRNEACGLLNIWRVHKDSIWTRYLPLIYVFNSWLIYTYYMMISGWVLIYFIKSIFGTIAYNTSDIGHYQQLLDNMYANPTLVILFTFLAIAMTAVVNIRGVSKGIEKLSLIGMPLLFIILVIMVIRVLTLDNAMGGLKFYFSFTYEDFTLRRMLTALGQAFFALSLGLGILITYSSYIKDNNNLLNAATNTAVITSIISILSGATIVPALFIFGYTNAGGPGLIFASLPAVFSQIYAGQFFAILFFALVIIATITSTVSLLEVIAPVMQSFLRISRTASIILISGITLIVSMFQVWSFNILENFKIFGRTIFEFSDFITSNVFMPIGAIIVCLYVGFVINRRRALEPLLNNDNRRWVAFLRVYQVWFFWIKYIAPILIAIILVLSIRG